jgi:hypothetical protein
MIFKRIRKWLEDMTKRNEQRVVNQRLDCCNLNFQKKPGTTRINPHSRK